MVSNIIIITPVELQKMVDGGVNDWYAIGLKIITNWPETNYECLIIDEKRYMLAKIKYGI